MNVNFSLMIKNEYAIKFPVGEPFLPKIQNLSSLDYNKNLEPIRRKNNLYDFKSKDPNNRVRVPYYRRIQKIKHSP